MPMLSSLRAWWRTSALQEVRFLLRRLVPTVTIAVLNSLIVAGLILTVGRATSTAEDLAASVDSAGARKIVVQDPKGTALITAERADTLRSASTVESVVSFGTVSDYHVPDLPDRRLAMWLLDNGLRQVVTLNAGRWPEPGEAIVPSGLHRNALGWESPFGALEAPFSPMSPLKRQVPVVGSFTPQKGWEEMARGGIIRAAVPAYPGQQQFQKAEIVVRPGAPIPAAGQLISGVYASPPGFERLQVQTPTSLETLQGNISRSFSTYGQGLFWAVLIGGGVVVAGVVFGETMALRRDIGRRRVLGASFSQLVAILTARVAIVAGTGAVLGAVTAVVALGRHQPSAQFCVGTVLLASLISVVGGLPPIITAARVDPVRVLRTA